MPGLCLNMAILPLGCRHSNPRMAGHSLLLYITGGDAMNQAPRPSVFISHHDADRDYKKRFIQMMGDSIVDVSVDEDDIDDTDLADETVRQEIRNRYIRRASVAVVLIGSCTWQRMHVDAEIHFSIRQTDYNQRCGLLGIWLPDHSDYHSEEYNERLMPARLADNVEGDDPYARLYDWPRKRARRRETVRRWIDEALMRRRGTPPSSSRPLLPGNIGGDCTRGW